MKKLSVLILAIATCFIIASCGGTTITGDPQSYSNADGSLSIELPTEDENSWVIKEDTPSSILDISDKGDTINIRVQCVSKDQVKPVATDLESYRDYSMINTLGDILADADISDAEADVPEFISKSIINSFSMSGDVTGTVLYMESDSCYYTYFIMAVDKAYSSNESALLDSVLTLREITEVPAGEKNDGKQ